MESRDQGRFTLFTLWREGGHSMIRQSAGRRIGAAHSDVASGAQAPGRKCRTTPR